MDPMHAVELVDLNRRLASNLELDISTFNDFVDTYNFPVLPT